jgi:hypothetical protein
MFAVNGIEKDFVRARTASARLMPSRCRSSLGGSHSRAVSVAPARVDPGLLEFLPQEPARWAAPSTDLVAQLGAELNSIPGDPTGDAAAQRVDLQQRHDFTARNFEEIQRTIRYACETPVALDARLGAWAKALQNAASP